MAVSTILALPLIATGQEGSEPLHNVALEILEAHATTQVIDSSLSAAPGSPTDGDRYVVAATPGGGDAWFGHVGDLAVFAGDWYFAAPRDGMVIWETTANVFRLFDGAAWLDLTGTAVADVATISVTDPAAAPATATILRDDLVTNAISEIRTHLNDLRSQFNALVASLEVSHHLKP